MNNSRDNDPPLQVAVISFFPRQVLAGDFRMAGFAGLTERALGYFPTRNASRELFGAVWRIGIGVISRVVIGQSDECGERLFSPRLLCVRVCLGCLLL